MPHTGFISGTTRAGRFSRVDPKEYYQRKLTHFYLLRAGDADRRVFNDHVFRNDDNNNTNNNQKKNARLLLLRVVSKTRARSCKISRDRRRMLFGMSETERNREIYKPLSSVVVVVVVFQRNYWNYRHFRHDIIRIGIGLAVQPHISLFFYSTANTMTIKHISQCKIQSKVPAYWRRLRLPNPPDIANFAFSEIDFVQLFRVLVLV